MKATQILSLSVVLTVSAAQSFQSLPDCGKLCVNNMLAKAQELGCASGDAACLCRNVDFAYGIRDCSTDVCGAQQVAPVISYGEGYCKNAGTGNAGSGGANSSLPGPIVSSSSSILPATTLTSMTGQGSAIATSALVSLVTHGTEVSTSTFSLTTIFGTETASSPTQTQSSETSMVTSSIESSPTSTSEPSSSSTGSGTKPTAFAGLAAVAGLAAMIL